MRLGDGVGGLCVCLLSHWQAGNSHPGCRGGDRGGEGVLGPRGGRQEAARRRAHTFSFIRRRPLNADAAHSGLVSRTPPNQRLPTLSLPTHHTHSTQALVLEADADRAPSSAPPPEAAFYEITVASVDAPKLLSRLSEALGDVGLNIAEAHAFNTADGFSLDLFVVNGWGGTPDAPDELEDVLSDRLQQLPPPLATAPSDGADAIDASSSPARAASGSVAGARPGVPASALPLPPDDFELGADDVVCHERVASGAFGDLYRGVYCGAEVAVKVLRGVATDAAAVAEFAQEVAIMRKVRHRNVVQFIGACTRPPNLCIVFEFLRGGSVFDWMRRHGAPRLPAALKMAAEVARGMDYLHKRRVVHRDLKAANLLLDDAGCVKIADFGVARLLDTSGVMTAETGTYRWMAPEVIEHTPYTEKADIYSYGVLVWELLTARVPYDTMTPLQAAVGVVQKGLRPPIPPGTPADLAAVMAACWDRDPSSRPSFDELKGTMEALYLAARAARYDAGWRGGRRRWRGRPVEQAA